jgi:hypothetical protein
MKDVRCPLCRTRKARRRCPALGRDICALCCGTKRLAEIRCPADCGYLASARQHPPAALQRRQERDLQFLLPLVQALTEPQSRLFLFVQAVIRRAPITLPAPTDRDVAEATRALAATLETAASGLLYEHPVATTPARRLFEEIKTRFSELSPQERGVSDGDASIVLRQVAEAADAAATALGEGETAYLELIGRMMREPPRGGAAAASGARIVLA